MPSRNPSPPHDEGSPLPERVAAELRRIAAWAMTSAMQAERIPPGAADPAYDEDETGEPRNTAAQLESHLSLLLEEYLTPARHEMARVAGVLQIWRNEHVAERPSLLAASSAAGDDSAGMTTMSKSFPSEQLAAAFAEFARAAGDFYGIEVRTIEKGRHLALVLVPGSADNPTALQCLSLLLEPWATTDGAA